MEASKKIILNCMQGSKFKGGTTTVGLKQSLEEHQAMFSSVQNQSDFSIWKNSN